MEHRLYPVSTSKAHSSCSKEKRWPESGIILEEKPPYSTQAGLNPNFVILSMCLMNYRSLACFTLHMLTPKFSLRIFLGFVIFLLANCNCIYLWGIMECMGHNCLRSYKGFISN